jgi:DNA-binding HxlR family transcriptional regulator/putative sterol carrier protein
MKRRTMTLRRYGDACGIATALDIVGERWALLLVRELLLGPKRFADLQAGLPGAGPNVLTQRLQELEAAGVIRRRTLPPPAGSRVYELTEWGAELDTIMSPLGRWGIRSPVVPVAGKIGADSIMLGLRNSFVPQARRPWTASYEIALGRDRFRVRVADGSLVEVARGHAANPDATIETDPGTLKTIISGSRTLAAAVKAGDVSVSGDRKAVQRLVDAIGM